MIVSDIIFNLVSPYKSLVLRDYASAFLDFLLTYRSGARVFGESTKFMDILPRFLLCKLSSI